MALKVVFISIQITYPFGYFPSNWNILAFLRLFDLLCFKFAVAQLVLILWLYKIFQHFKSVECIECQKNKQEVEWFQMALKVVFISMQISYPFGYFPSNWNILGFLQLFDLLCFILYYFCESWILSWEFTLSKRKKPWGNVVFTMTVIHVYFASLTLILNSPSFGRSHWTQKCRLWFLRCLPFWAPCLF